jgi:hypothetical protein
MATTVPPQQITAAQKLAQVNEQTWLTMGKQLYAFFCLIKKIYLCIC